MELSQLHDTHLEPPCAAQDHFSSLYVPVFAAQESAPAKAEARRHLLSLPRWFVKLSRNERPG
jgi:hypothetical protein